MNLDNIKYIIVSGPVIIEKNKVLLNKEKDDNIWQFLGGTVKVQDLKSNSILETTCKREVKEEMGIDVEIIQPLKPIMMQHPEKIDIYLVLIHYLAKRIGEIKKGYDIKEYKWWDINALPKDCAPNIRPVIENYKKTKK